MNLGQRSLTWQTGAAVTSFVLLLTLAGVWLVEYLESQRELQAQLEIKTRILERLSRPSIATAAEDGVRQRNPEAAAIVAASETVAASELHKTILDSLEEGGGSVHSIQAQATADILDEKLRRITAQVTFDSSLDALQRILLSLETTRPYIFIESIAVQPSPSTRPGGHPWDILRVSFAASSYWQSVGAEPMGRAGGL